MTDEPLGLNAFHEPNEELQDGTLRRSAIHASTPRLNDKEVIEVFRLTPEYRLQLAEMLLAEWRFRQAQLWKIQLQGFVLFAALTVTPWFYATIIAPLGPFIFVFPTLSFMFSLGIAWLWNAELERMLRPLRDAHELLGFNRSFFSGPPSWRKKRANRPIGATLFWVFLTVLPSLSMLNAGLLAICRYA